MRVCHDTLFGKVLPLVSCLVVRSVLHDLSESPISKLASRRCVFHNGEIGQLIEVVRKCKVG